VNSNNCGDRCTIDQSNILVCICWRKDVSPTLDREARLRIFLAGQTVCSDVRLLSMVRSLFF
jgi:hypothetical protein